MRSIYFLSDIHGNLPALEAVIQDIGEEEFMKSQKYFLGDYVHFAPFTNEVINLISILPNANFIEGNHDIYCSKKELNYKKKYKANLPEMITHIDWIRKRISEKNIKWLASNPKQIELNLNGKSFLLFHGHFNDTESKIDITDNRLSN